jgi:AcrR family transcriptional regulator
MARTRSTQARDAVLAAGFEVLVADGVGGFTIDEVVARSGVAKSTIYRWWPNRQALLLDVIHEQLVPAATPNTGDVRADLLTYFAGYLAAPVDTPASRLLPELCSAAQRDPDLAELRDTLVIEKRQPVLTILELARARGELPPDADLEVIATLVIGPLAYTKSMRGQRVDPELAARAIDAALGSPQRTRA